MSDEKKELKSLKTAKAVNGTKDKDTSNVTSDEKKDSERDLKTEKSFDLSDFEEKEDEVISKEKELSFLEHFAELRLRLIKGLLIIIPFVFISYELSSAILEFLSQPLIVLLPSGQGLIATALPETFIIHLKISLWAGLFLSSPFWLYQAWAFVAPGLYQKERSSLIKLTLLAFLLLLLGGAFAYYVVLPIGFKFFVGFGTGTVTILPVIHEYLSLVMTLILAFGCAFELPLLLLFLAQVGLVNSSKLKKFRQYAILIIVTVSAFLTPPDVVSQILMSIPMYGLYELSVFLIKRRELGGSNGDEGGKEEIKKTKEAKKAEVCLKKEEKKALKIKLKEEKKELKIKLKEEKKALKTK
jgi:sec-independent protein translocase protein TatC